MDQSLQQLKQRISDLELILDEDGSESSILAQLDTLKSKLAEVYQSHPEFLKLNEINTTLKTWNKQKPSGVSQEIKRETIKLHYDDMLKTYPEIIEVLNTQYDTIINGINKTILSTDIQNDKNLLISKKENLEHVLRLHQALTIKSMIVLEKYVENTLKENKFWLNIEEQMNQLNAKINKIEDAKTKLNRY